MNILSVKNLYYRADNTDIINGISLDVQEGDCISIMGASGSGKSTFLKLCADLIPANGGDLVYRNQSYEAYNPLNLRQKISYCVQMPYLFGETVMDNLSFPFSIRHAAVDFERIDELLKRFNLDESFLDKEVNALSGGEKQRIALVRNLIYTPDILLLDEATSALDELNALAVENYVAALNQEGVTVLWVTHNLNQSASIFNKRVVFDAGVIKDVEVLR